MACGYSHRLDPHRSELRIPHFVPFRPVAHVVRCAVDLDAQLRPGTIEIEGIAAELMLSAKMDPFGRATKQVPQQHFWKGHLAAELARLRCVPWQFLALRLPLRHALRVRHLPICAGAKMGRVFDTSLRPINQQHIARRLRGKAIARGDDKIAVVGQRRDAAAD